MPLRLGLEMSETRHRGKYSYRLYELAAVLDGARDLEFRTEHLLSSFEYSFVIIGNQHTQLGHRSEWGQSLEPCPASCHLLAIMFFRVNMSWDK